VLCVLLAVATFSVYFRATMNPFVNYDDQGYVTENTHVQQGLTWGTVHWALVSSEASNWHPLTWTSHALDFQLYGLNAAGHHLTSILLHTLNAVLLFLLLFRATGKTARSLLVTSLFALHPINVESVAWVAERKSVLCMFFFLLTLGAYGWYARRPNLQRYLAVAGLFVLALAAKPMAVTLPFVLLLVDFWPLHRVLGVSPPSAAFPLRQTSFRSLILEKLPLLLLSIASSVITMVVQGAAISTNAGLPVQIRLANALYAYSMYVVKAFWPVHLAAYYPYQGSRLSVWEILLCVLFLTLCSAWVWSKRSSLVAPVGWFWYLGTLIPVIGLVQVGDQGMADRYAYFPLIGIFVILVWTISDWIEGRHFATRPWAAAAVVILAALSFLTWRQIGTWHSSYELWSHALSVTQDNYMAEDYVGTVLLVDTFEHTGQRYSEEALVHFQRAAAINPRDAISHLNIGADYHEHGRLQEAIQQYRTAVGLVRDPHLMEKSLFGLGDAYHQLGNDQEAIQAYQAALDVSDDPHEQAKNFLALGDAYRQLGDPATAKQYYQKALKADPQNQNAFMAMGKLAMDVRIKQLVESASAHPSSQAYLQLGRLQVAAGRIPEARTSFHTALKLDPKSPETQEALNSLNSPAGR
jgi:tetratricopeptide (TPR) repeat protein